MRILLPLIATFIANFQGLRADVTIPAEIIYSTTCIVCHGPNGKGVVPGVRDLTEKNSRLLQPDQVLVQNVISGIRNPDNPLQMPPRGGNLALSESDIRNVLTYMRKMFLPR